MKSCNKCICSIRCLICSKYVTSFCKTIEVLGQSITTTNLTHCFSFVLFYQRKPMSVLAAIDPDLFLRYENLFCSIVNLEVILSETIIYSMKMLFQNIN